MTYNPIEIGSPDWGQPLNDALTSQDQRITDNEVDILGLETDVTGILPTINPLATYIPNGWGSNWKTARNNNAATLAVVGASSSLGYYASNLRSTGWVDLLRTALQNQYGNGGSGYKGSALTSAVQVADGVPAAATTAYTTAGNLATLVGSWSVGGNSYGPGAKYVFTSTLGDSYTDTVSGTIIDIFVVAGTTSPHTTYSYQIDGGAVVNVPTTGTTDNIQRTTITGLSNGPHTVVLKHAGTGGQFVSIIGMAGRNPTGITVNNFARYGSRAANFAAADSTTNTDWNGAFQYPANLVILTHGPNDALNNDSGDTWAKNMRIIMERIRNNGGATGTTDLMIMLPNVGTFDSTTNIYQDYVARARGLAEGFNAAFVDIWTLGRNSWNYWESLGYWANASVPGTAGTDSVHPSDAGHQFIYNTVLPIINGD